MFKRSIRSLYLMLWLILSSSLLVWGVSAAPPSLSTGPDRPDVNRPTGQTLSQTLTLTASETISLVLQSDWQDPRLEWEGTAPTVVYLPLVFRGDANQTESEAERHNRRPRVADRYWLQDPWRVRAPFYLSFDEGGSLYAGNAGGRYWAGKRTFVHRITPDGQVNRFGRRLPDPDGVVVDQQGLFGEPGSLLVGGIWGARKAHLSLITPDGQTDALFRGRRSRALSNPQQMVIAGGRLLYTNCDPRGRFGTVGMLEPGGEPEVLIDLGQRVCLLGLAVDPVSGDIYLSHSKSGRIYRYAADGTLLDDNVVSGLWGPGPLLFDTSGQFGGGLIVSTLDRQVLLVNPETGTSQVLAERILAYGLALGPDNCLYVSDARRNRIWPFCANAARTWQRLAPVTSPSISGEGGLVYDTGRQVAVLYGGNSGWPYPDSTWEYSDRQWTLVQTSQTPDARYGLALAYDPARQRTFLFGGSDIDDTPLNQTWVFNGRDWQPLSPATTPPSRTYATMTADPQTGTVYLFGGNEGVTYYNDLWTFAGTDWQALSPGGQIPPARTLTALAFDEANRRLLLFGGRSLNGLPLADLWAFDPAANSWTLLDPGDGSGPSARMAHTLTYDPVTQAVLLFGGSDQEEIPFADSWTYQTGWVEQASPTPFPSQSYHHLSANPTDQTLILFGNQETWIYE